MHRPELRDDKASVGSEEENLDEIQAFAADTTLSLKASRPEVRVPKAEPVHVTAEVSHSSKDAHYRDDIFYVPAYGEPLVQKWEDYFTGKGRRHMEKYLDRLPRYEALMKGILKEEGVPPELIYIALIESGFNSTAYSRARAVGYWQFIRGTGKSYGLKQNWLVDERRDPILSTRAAANYFKALYQAFGSWHLAMSSYNAGEHRVLRAVMGNMTREFWELHEKKQLPRETLNYVPKFIAAAKIATNPAKYGFSHIEGQEPFSFEEIQVSKGISLSKFAKNLGVTTKEIKRLNPTFKTDYAPIYRGAVTSVRVPVGKKDAALVAATKSYSSQKYVASSGSDYHRVRRGDSLYKIARRYGTSVRTLKRLNGLTSRSIIRPGRKIKLPGSGKALARSSRSTASLKGDSYKVRSGDNLWTIAKRFGVSVRGIKRWNNLYSSKLRVGQVLKIKSGGTSTSSSSKVHYVKRGENLTKIARRYGVSLSKLIRHNGLRSSSTLVVGAKIVIP